MNSKYKEWASHLSDKLGVKCPRMRHTNDKCSKYFPKENIIYVADYENELDTLLAIAHEVRHVWQVEKGIDLSQSIIQGSVDTDTYNHQPHEIDANAFGKLAMESEFGVSPRWDGYSDEVVHLINRQARKIQEKGFEYY